MNFVSTSFLLFFPAIAAGYFLLPARARQLFLLIASYYFYMSWKPEYVLLILASTAIDYLTGLSMGKVDNLRGRRMLLGVSLAVNLGILFGFKYFNFFSDSSRAVFEQIGIGFSAPSFDLLLPVGISFYTFQTLSYTIDVYKRRRDPERDIVKFALYVAFFPQLVAGPIERSTRLLPQFDRIATFDYDRVTNGLKLMVWGYFLKVVIADNLAVHVDRVYGSPESFAGPSLMLATILFGYQIYGDFAGYSAIAIGAASVLGIDLMKNFDRPYASRSVREFWRRWHISLSTWFRDYVYFPLGGNRAGGRSLHFRNLMIVFLVSGLWHGASWTFVAWGALHGAYIVAGIATQRVREQTLARLTFVRRGWMLPLFRTAWTFAIVNFAWIFFRATDIAQAMDIAKRSILGTLEWLGSVFAFERNAALSIDPWLMGESLMTVLGLIALIVFLEIAQWLLDRYPIDEWSFRLPPSLRWSLYYSIILALLLFGRPGTAPFIYFQF